MFIILKILADLMLKWFSAGQIFGISVLTDDHLQFLTIVVLCHSRQQQVACGSRGLEQGIGWGARESLQAEMVLPIDLCDNPGSHLCWVRDPCWCATLGSMCTYSQPRESYLLCSRIDFWWEGFNLECDVLCQVTWDSEVCLLYDLCLSWQIWAN